MSNRLFRSRIAALATFGIVAASLVTIAPAANANGSDYSPSSYAFDRGSSDGKSMLIKDGERVSVYSQQFLSNEYTWPAPLRSVFTRSAFTQTRASLSGLTLENDSKWRYWQGGGDDENCSLFSETTNLTINSGNRCINNMYVTDQVTISNESGSSKTLVTNADSQVLKAGKRNISNAVGADRNFYAYVESPQSDSVTLVEGESYVSANFVLCLNEDLVEAGDELAFEATWSRNGNPVSSADINISYYDNEGLLQTTYTVPEENPYDQVIYFSVSPDSENSGVGTHVATADVVLRSDSVIEECPESATEPGWPTLTTVDGDNGAPQATTTSRTMPTDKFTGSNWNRYQVFSDGFGGAFHSGVSNEDGAGTVTLVQLGATGPQNGYNGSGGRDLPSDSEGYFDFGRYGEAGANQFTLVRRAKGNWEYTSSTMAGTNPVTQTFTKAALSKLCQKGFTFNWMNAVSAPTVNPMVLVGCTDRTSYRQVLVSIVNNVPTVLTRFGSPTKSRPCVGVNLGTNSSATGSDVALVAYTATSSRSSDGYCTRGDVTVSARTITNVTAAGVVSTSEITSSPWDEPGEPFYVELAPDSTSGNWVGISFSIGTDFEGVPSNLFTMTGSTITEGQALTLDDTTDFGYRPLYDIVKKVSSSEWLISIDSGDMWHDGEYVARATVASVNTSTGDVTNGDVIELSGFGIYSSRTRGLFSGNGPSGTTFFAMTNVNTYSTTTWAVP
jgi:hypothetical protein